MTIRVYSSLDTGAPALTGNTYSRMRAILTACLVYGYGSKAAAGWSMPHDVADGCSFSNGDALLNLVHVNDNNVQFYSMEYITDPTTALAGGYNRRSGRWADNTVTDRQNLYGHNVLGPISGTNPHWFVVADDKTCILVMGSNAGSADASTVRAFYFGRYQNTQGLTGAAEWCSIGPDYALNGTSSQWFMWAVNSRGARAGTLLRHPVTGLVFPTGDTHVAAASAAYRTANGDIKLSALARICLTRTPLLLLDGSVNGPVGYLRGVLQDGNLCSSSLTDVLAAFGQSNTWQQRVTPLTLPGGKQVLPYWPSGTTDHAYFISLDAADWGDL